MKKGICHIIGAGENDGLDFTPTTNDFVIAADTRIRYLEQRGLVADLVIGISILLMIFLLIQILRIKPRRR